jgi:diguanylate cyclase (GGDEF)-like protein
MMNSVFQHLTWFQDHHPVSVLVGDLDGFKRVNDSNGNQVGDEYLIRVAHALYEAVPETATVYRVGGDEFAFVLPGTDEEALAELAGSVLEAVAAVRTDCGVGTTITLGGTTMHEVPDGYGSELKERELLLRRVLIAADEACTTAKVAGRNRYAFRQFV